MPILLRWDGWLLEVNLSRMYSGAGSGPMMAAVSALAGGSQPTRFSRARLQRGDRRTARPGVVRAASTAMIDAPQPQIEWITTAAAKAEETAGQARAAGAAYESA